MSRALMGSQQPAYYPWDWGMPVAERTSAMTNHNPKRDRAHAIAAEVRARRPEMQVRRLAVPLNTVN